MFTSVHCLLAKRWESDSQHRTESTLLPEHRNASLAFSERCKARRIRHLADFERAVYIVQRPAQLYDGGGAAKVFHGEVVGNCFRPI